MSLQVWLPLTKDLRQQGLSNVIVTNNGATFNSAGKLGGCYEFASGKRIQTTLPASTSLNAKAISFACWMYVTSWNSSYDCFMSIADGTGWVQSRATLCRNNTASTLTWNIADGTNRAYVTTTTALSLNTWTHIAGTYDGANLKIYINGVLNNTSATTLSIGYAGTFNIGGWSGNNYPFNGRLNDVRIYNHCLSPMEVKELAKGLVLHYPLNRQGWGNENIVKGSNTNSVSTNLWYHSNATGGTTREIIIENGVPCLKITRDNVAQTSWHYFSYAGLDHSKLKTSTTYTISFDLKPSVDGAVTINGFANGNALDNITQNSIVIQGTVIANRWNHVILQTTTKSSFADYTVGGQCVYMYLSASLRDVGTWVMMKNIKVEEGTKETPWCPHINDPLYTTMNLNNNIEYDCSGFCNNGEKIGALTYTSDTPKYNVATYCPAGTGVFGHPNITFSQFTIAFWGKHSATGKMLMGSNASTSSVNTNWYWYGDNSFKYPGGEFYYSHNAGSADSLLNKWTHFVATYDGANVTVYRNGIYEGVKALTGTQTLEHVSIGNGYSSSSYWENGYVSDLRIYATALSADDVLSLYQNSAYIDSSGNVYGAVHTEV